MKLSEIVTEATDAGPTGSGPLELSALARYYHNRPEDLKRKLNQHWGSERLVYHGMKFFDKTGLGEAYHKADEAVKHFMKGDFTVQMAFDLAGGDHLGFHTFEYDASVDDSQEVYLGYNPHNDHLYMGVDAWLREDDFNEAWDKEFEKETGEAYDEEDPEHSKLFHEAWKEYTNMHGYGILFELTPRNDDFEVDVVEDHQGGFYGGIYKTSGMKRLGLIDIRLD